MSDTIRAFNVRLGSKVINRVFYAANDQITAEEVKRSLVNHDGYDSAIVVNLQRAKRVVAVKDWACQECGKRMTLKQAEKASMGATGCPKCGGSDIDLAR